ncbi:chondroitin sulfate proteoglycan 4-like [Patiria miniata]|uniref:Laminin G domain-containing protein n=1 Tax=Patiria miniata TaxID=46514 RepID=A0A914BM03_PATMI|nr:chondroitin sulfate proteoglycan 4-like [Patiria miniata]
MRPEYHRGGERRYRGGDAMAGVVMWVVALQLMLAASGVSAVTRVLSKKSVWFEHASSLAFDFPFCKPEFHSCFFTASFYGTSHVYLPLSQASTETSIHLVIKTSRSKGLLLLAAGDTDYCIIQIRSGVIEARVNLGGGELAVRSLPKEKLNDLTWHSIRVELARGWLELYIDGVLHREERVVGQADTLNVQDGIYVGGTGMQKASYLKSADRFFRGCIENITYNDILVFNATAADKRSTVNDITWDCSEEFEAPADSPISFVKETAFVLYPRWQMDTHGSFACWLKTSSPLGLLMFSSGFRTQFVSAEVADGRIRVLMDRGNGVVDFTSQVPINDGNWHWIKIDIAPGNLRISIDYEPENVKLSDTSSAQALSGMLHVGGVIHKARSQAFRSDLKSITHASSGGSFQGCMRDVEVNNELFTLGDSRVTHGIEIGCVYQFPCSTDPCLWTETCTDTGPENFVCQCLTDECLESKQPSTDEPLLETSIPSRAETEPVIPINIQTELPEGTFSLVPISVEEGGRSVISSSNIHLNLKLRSYGLRESQLVLLIVKPPLHGRIESRVLRHDDDSSRFTLLDLMGSKIFYIHDGSENFYDELTIKVEILGRNVEIPEVLQGVVNFTLGINISPVNDVPSIALADDATLRMIKGSVQPIHSSFLGAIDPDNDPSDLLFTIVNQQANVGYFQKVSNAGESIVSFTQEDINNEQISYVHTGPSTKSRIVIRLFDGLEKSPLYSFRIEVIPLELSILNATELRLNPGSSVEITPAELNVATNDPEGHFEVSYRLTDSLRFGRLQQLELLSWWADVTEFTQADVDDGIIRYVATVSDKQRSIWNDRISLSASSEDVSIDVVLPVKIVVTSVEVTNNTGLILNVVRQGVITSENLAAEVRLPITFSSPRTFTVIRPPSRGQLVKQTTGLIPIGGSFTQEDIAAGMVSYFLDPSEEEALNDTFLFQVSVVNAQSSVTSFIITFIPDVRNLVVTNKGLNVTEGGTVVITTDKFFVTADNITDFAYTITKPPEHGRLLLTDPSTFEVSTSDVITFLNYDLMNDFLRYMHDDSETQADSFEFTASASYTDLSGRKRSLHHEGTFDINILLQNDHEPEVVVNRLFKVVKGGKTPLTDQNLLSADRDENLNDDNLEYQRENTDVGDLIYAANESSVYRFTQRQLKDGLIAFRQRGDILAGRMLFYVFDDDRSRFASDFLDIEASEPFVGILNNSGLKISRGSSVVLTSCNLSAETNLGIKDNRIEFLITSQPSHGQLLYRGNPAIMFNQEGLEAGRVVYHHDNSTAMMDSFNFTIRARSMVKEAVFNIRIYVASHQELPEVEQLKPLVVEQGQAVIIDRSHLRITHPNHLPIEIVFTVTVQPKFGILQLSDESLSPTRRGRRQAEEQLKTFTQLDVNRNRLRYVQTEPGVGVDRFSFEVDNGFVKVSNLTFAVEIAPTVVPLAVADFFLPEGGSKAITNEIIQVANPYYQKWYFDFTIQQEPIHGFLETTRNAGERLTSFSTRDLTNELIYYVHDGSDTLNDSFTIAAISSETGKTSLSYTINITVTPVNDQKPEVTVNNGLTLFIGTQAQVTTDVLSTMDLDTDDQSLTYILTAPTNGYLVKLPDKTTQVMSFTQSDLNNGDIVFIQSGLNTGGFRFSVSDGVHSTVQQIFSITARPLLVSLESHAMLYVEPNSIEPITAQHLKAVTNEEPKTNLSQPIRFLITEAPKHGIIVEILDRDEIDEEILSFAQISTFTQAQIDRNVVAYKQILDSPVTEDQFTFSVVLPLSQNLTDQIFEISIGLREETTTAATTVIPTTILPTTEPSLILNLGIEVQEGGTASITDKQLNIATLAEDLGEVESVFEYNIVSLPSHGVLKKSNQEITAFSTFMQEDLVDDGIQYIHDHSDERQDSFNFTVTATAVGSTEQLVAYTGQFVITIDPVNDQPFRVLTRTLSMTITQGSNKTLTMDDLNTVDADNPPDEISYVLLSSPSNGKIVLTSDQSTVIQEFTQKQINDGEVTFVHDGGVVSGGFLFRLTDGARMKLKQFSIIVEPVTLDVAITGNLTLTQGDSLAVIPSTIFNVTTNDDGERIRYNISTAPEYGEILVDSVATSSFSQAQLNQGSVQYSQTDFSSEMDLVKFTVFDDYNILEDLNLTVTIKPAITLKLMNITTGKSLALTTEYLNASELSSSIGGGLAIEITRSPQRGLILNSTSNLAISEFPYSDVVNARVLYVADFLNLGVNDTLDDSFVFVLSGERVQPATLTFQVRIVPPILVSTTSIAPLSTTVQPVTRRINTINFGINRAGEIPLPTEEVTTSTATSGNTPIAKSFEPSGFNPVFVIIPIIVIIVIIILVLFVLIWRSRSKEKKHVSGRESPYPEPDVGPYPGAQAGPGQTGLMPTVQVSGACPDHHSTGSLNGTPPVTMVRPVPIQGPYVPQVTVTQLGRPPSPNYPSSFASVNSNGTVQSGGSSHSSFTKWDSYKPEVIDYCPAKKPTLKKSQYWV